MREHFRLPDENKARLAIAYGPGHAPVRALVDDDECARAPGVKEGHPLVGTLPDGRHLEVHLRDGALGVLCNGKPLERHRSGDAKIVREGFHVGAVVAAINIALGLAALVVDSRFLAGLGAGVASLVFGAVFVPLAYFMRRQSRIAFAVGAVLLAVDFAMLLLGVLEAGGRPPIAGIVVRGAFVYFLGRSALITHRWNREDAGAFTG